VAEEEYGNRHWHLALMELLRGKLKPGFARYRSRFREVGGLKRPNFSRPLWKGEDLNGKTILILDEQGFGDTFRQSPPMSPTFLVWSRTRQRACPMTRVPP
jgi:hypothetical protein